MDRLIPDIPRFYTGLAEWLGCMMILFTVPRRVSRTAFAALSSAVLAVLCGFLILTVDAPPGLAWIACMAAAVLIMFGFITGCADMTVVASVYCTSGAFLCAEFAAALEWQLHTWFSYITGLNPAGSVIILACIYAAVFLTVFRILRSQLSAEYMSRITWKEAVSFLLIALITFIFSNVSFFLNNTPFSGQVMVDIFTIRTLVDLGGLAILFSFQSRLSELITQEELASVRHVLSSQYEQYRNYQESEEMLHMMQHDLKHQIEGLRALDDKAQREEWIDHMSDVLEEWRLPHRTGNAVFDTILAAKLRKARTLGIRITCVADGSLLDKLHVADICTIFGNAIDNAMESVVQIEDEEKRLIHISVTSRNGFIFIGVENILGTEIREASGTLLTTKADKASHGYGMKGIRYAVEKYGGNVSHKIENGWFMLNILIPMTR